MTNYRYQPKIVYNEHRFCEKRIKELEDQLRDMTVQLSLLQIALEKISRKNHPSNKPNPFEHLPSRFNQLSDDFDI